MALLRKVGISKPYIEKLDTNDKAFLDMFKVSSIYLICMRIGIHEACFKQKLGKMLKEIICDLNSLIHKLFFT